MTSVDLNAGQKVANQVSLKVPDQVDTVDKTIEQERQQMQRDMLALGVNYKLCPSCGQGIEIVQEACRIFICGETKDGQLNPHDEQRAEAAVQAGKVYLGCGKQCQLIDGQLIPCTGK